MPKLSKPHQASTRPVTLSGALTGATLRVIRLFKWQAEKVPASPVSGELALNVKLIILIYINSNSHQTSKLETQPWWPEALECVNKSF